MRVRRSLAAGSGRWLLYPVVAVMAVAAVGGAVETVGLTADQHSYAMPGRLYDVGGHRLHLDCTGSGSPTVVLMSGLGEFSAAWARIAPPVAGTTRVCAYDRAGQGWSEDAAEPQDGVAAAADLHTLLAPRRRARPVRAGRALHRRRLRDDLRRPLPRAGRRHGPARHHQPLPDRRRHDPRRSARPIALLPSVARLGVGRLLPTSTWSALPEPAASRYAAFASSPRGWQNTVDEAATMPALFDQAQRLTTLGSTPLVVLTAAGHDARPRSGRPRRTGWPRCRRTAATARRTPGTRGLLDEAAGAQQSARRHRRRRPGRPHRHDARAELTDGAMRNDLSAPAGTWSASSRTASGRAAPARYASSNSLSPRTARAALLGALGVGPLQPVGGPVPPLAPGLGGAEQSGRLGASPRAAATQASPSSAAACPGAVCHARRWENSALSRSPSASATWPRPTRAAAVHSGFRSARPAAAARR